MSWLIGSTLASIVAGFLAVRIFDYIAAGAAGAVVGAAKATVFASVWTAVTTGSGMRAFSDRMRSLRQSIGKRR